MTTRYRLWWLLGGAIAYEGLRRFDRLRPKARREGESRTAYRDRLWADVMRRLPDDTATELDTDWRRAA